MITKADLSVKMRNFRNTKSARVLTRIVQYAVLTLLALILIFPYLYMVSRSFMMSEQVALRQPIEFIPAPFSVEGWSMFFQGDYMMAFFRTVLIVAINVIVVPCSASLVAYGFAKIKFAGSSILFAVMLATMMIPSTVTQIPLYVMYTNLGWINSILPFVIPNFFGGGAIYIFLVRQFMKGIPNEMDNAARLDGANLFQRYLLITVPLCLPVLIYVMVNVFNAYWGDFYGPLLYMNQEGKETLAFKIYLDVTQLRVTPNYENLRMASGVFMSILPTVFFVLFQKQLIEGVTLDGLKG